MMELGLCTMSFQQQTPEQVLEICRGTKIKVIEWSGRQQHLPPETAAGRVKEIASRCRDMGLAILSYGSYFGVFNDEPETFAGWLDVAEGLGCGTVRVWSGHWNDPGELSELSSGQVERLVDRTARVAAMGAERGLRVAFEYHGRTPTCGAEEVLGVIEKADHANMYTYWQMLPEVRRSVAENLADIDRVWPRLAYVHCHYFIGDELHPMRKGDALWRPVVAKLKKKSYSGPLYLEYYKDYTPALLQADLDYLESLL